MQYPKQHYNQFHDDLEFQILEREPQAKEPIIIRNQASLNKIEQQQQENFYNQNHIEKIDISHNNGIQLELQKIKIEKHMQIQKLASFEEEDDKQFIQKSDTCNYFLLGFLYLYQGLIIGFIEGSIPIILIQSGASFAQLGILSFTGYPWSFQMLSAPIFDTYYSRSFGKRKTYLIPLQLASSIILIATSFYINNLIETQNIGLLFIIGVSLEYIYSVQDITVGGWALTLLKPENVHMASSCQQIGQTLGSTLAYTGYIWLNSPQKLNQYLGTDIQEPILDPQRFFTISSVLIFIGTFYVMFFKKEEMAEDHCKNYEKEKQNRKGLFDNLRKLKGFYTNPNLRLLIFYRLIMPLSTAPIDNLSDLILLKKGLSREIQSYLSLLLIPISLLFSYLATFLGGQRKEMTCMFIALLVKFLNSFFKFYLTQTYEKGVNDSYILRLLFLNYFIDTVQGTIQSQLGQSFIYRNCDKSMGGSYLSMMNSLSNFGGTWAGSAILFLAQYLEFETQYYISIVIFIFLYYSFLRPMLNFEKSDISFWTLKNTEKIKEE